jgi:hypothetical protein
MTVVQNKLLFPDNTPDPNAEVTINLVAAVGSDGEGFVGTYSGSVVGPLVQKVDSNGQWSADLIPNSLISPANTYYRVRQFSAGVWGPSQYILVPAAGGPYLLFDVLYIPPGDLVAGQHGAANHSGDIFPDGTEQILGAGSIRLTQRTAASVPTPAAGDRTYFVDSADGKAKVKTSAGTSVDLEAGGGGSTPTGTGFRHVAAGVEDAAAKLVDTADINDNQVSNAKIRDSVARSVIGRAGATTGDPADIQASADGQYLARAAGSLVFQAIADADLPATIARDTEVTSAVSTHEAAADPHTGYQKESEKGAASGYASLDAGTLVPVAQLATGVPDGTKFMRDDRSWQVPSGGHTQSHDHSVSGDGTALVPESLEVTGGPYAQRGDISPTQITADQNDYNPTGLADAVVLRLATDATRTVTGLAGGADGRILKIINVGGNNLILAHNSASSSATNRFALPAATDFTLQNREGVELIYDSTSGFWRALGHAAPAAAAPTTADYLVGTAQAGLSAEIVVGTTPGGELGGTWASPTVDATHSGSAHHTQAHELASGTALGADHTVSGAAAGEVLRALSATTAAFDQLQHTDLGAVSADQHHPQAHGAADHTDRTMRLWQWARGGIVNDGSTSVVHGTVPNSVPAARLADAASQGIVFLVAVPADGVTGAMNIIIVWTPQATVAASAVRWEITAKVIASASDVTAAGTTTTFTGASSTHTVDIEYQEASTQILASVAANDIVKLEVRRLGSDAADTLTTGADLIGCFLLYTADA